VRQLGGFLLGNVENCLTNFGEENFTEKSPIHWGLQGLTTVVSLEFENGWEN